MWCSQRKFFFFTWEITIFHRNVAFEVGDNRPSCCGRCGRSCPGHQGSRPRIWSKRRIDRSKASDVRQKNFPTCHLWLKVLELPSATGPQNTCCWERYKKSPQIYRCGLELLTPTWMGKHKKKDQSSPILWARKTCSTKYTHTYYIYILSVCIYRLILIYTYRKKNTKSPISPVYHII